MQRDITGERSESLLELLILINHDVASALDLRTVLQRLILAATQHVGGERASIIVVDESGRPVDASILYQKTFHHHTTRQLRETLERGLAGWVIKNRQPTLVPDTRHDERWLRRPDDAADLSGAKSAICVPLIARGQTVGALTLVHATPNAFDQDHLRLAKAIADQASIAVLNARLYTDSSRQARIMTALVESAASFGSSLDIQEALDRILVETIQALQVETAAVGMLDGEDGELVLRAATGLVGTHLIGQRLPREEGAVGQVLSRGRALTLVNTRVASDPVLSAAFAGSDVRALMLAPIEAQSKPTGLILAVNPLAGRFEPEAEAVLRGIGALAGATIKNAQLFGRLQWTQQRYLELFEDSFDLVFVTDLEGRITEANRQAVKVTGLETDRLRMLSIGQLHDIDLDKVGRDFALLLRQGSVRYESALRTASGEVVAIEVRANPIEFSGAGAIHWTLHDLTERKQLDELRANLTTMIYHDLRSPLSNLTSSLDLLDGKVAGDDDTRATLAIAERSARRMRRLIDSLLDINRLEGGQKLTSQTANEPGDLVRAAVSDLAPTADARHHRIDTQISPGMPPITVDGDMLRRVLVNLLDNALKWSKIGDSVEVGVRQLGDQIEFWVQDHGPGIPAGDQKKIFEKFARHGTAPDGTTGLGLGLAFCQLAARAHDGSIHVVSRMGEGARFVLTLPSRTRGL